MAKGVESPKQGPINWTPSKPDGASNPLPRSRRNAGLPVKIGSVHITIAGRSVARKFKLRRTRFPLELQSDDSRTAKGFSGEPSACGR